MADFEQSTTLSKDPQTVFAYLSDVGNLPRYFDKMTSAHAADGEAVHTTADVNGDEVSGEAWFRVDAGKQRISWGSEGPNDYHGDLDVDAAGGGSVVTVRLHTERVDDGSIDSALGQTLANIKSQLGD